MVIDTYKINGCCIEIDNAYMATTKEATEKILQDISKVAYKILKNKEKGGKTNEN